MGWFRSGGQLSKSPKKQVVFSVTSLVDSLVLTPSCPAVAAVDLPCFWPICSAPRKWSRRLRNGREDRVGRAEAGWTDADFADTTGESLESLVERQQSKRLGFWFLFCPYLGLNWIIMCACCLLFDKRVGVSVAKLCYSCFGLITCHEDPWKMYKYFI